MSKTSAVYITGKHITVLVLTKSYMVDPFKPDRFYHMVIDKYMIAVTGSTVHRGLGRDGSHYIWPGTAVAGGAGAGAVGR